MDVDGIGGRLRQLREIRGLSQEQLAAGIASPSYISLIESGRRSPSEALLAQLASRLGVATEELLGLPVETGERSVELELNLAELALHSDGAAQAQRRFLRLAATIPPDSSEHRRAVFGAARAAEILGQFQSAVALLESLPDRDDQPWLPAVVALCRCYRELGDLTHSIEVAERAMARLRRLGLGDNGGAAEVLTSLAGSYLERGDLHKAEEVARQADAAAERARDRVAQAYALWNASLITEGMGRTEEALELSNQALALLRESDRARNLARLCVAHAWLLLQSDPPRVREAESVLAQAHGDLEEVGTAVDVAYCETELARCRLLDGDPERAVELATAALQRLHDAPLEAGRARTVLGAARAGLGDLQAAGREYREAADALRRLGASRQAAKAWRELGEFLAAAGLADEAIVALRHSAEAAGVRVPPVAARPDGSAR